MNNKVKLHKNIIITYNDKKLWKPPSYKKIADLLGVSKTTVSNYITNYKKKKKKNDNPFYASERSFRD